MLALRNLFGMPIFIKLLVGVIVAIGVKVGLQLDNQFVGMIVALFAVAIGAHAHVMASASAPAPAPPKAGPMIVVPPDMKIETPAERLASTVAILEAAGVGPPAPSSPPATAG